MAILGIIFKKDPMISQQSAGAILRTFQNQYQSVTLEQELIHHLLFAILKLMVVDPMKEKPPINALANLMESRQIK